MTRRVGFVEDDKMAVDDINCGNAALTLTEYMDAILLMGQFDTVFG